MSSKTPLKSLFDPSRHSVRNLKDGRNFIVTSTEDRLLRDGSYGTIDNPVRKSQWYDLLDRLYKNIFNQNVSEMSSVLGELYPSGEYRRDNLYRCVPSLREEINGLSPSQKRKLKRYANKLTEKQAEELRRILARKASFSPREEELGDKTTDDIGMGKPGSFRKKRPFDSPHPT